MKRKMLNRIPVLVAQLALMMAIAIGATTARAQATSRYLGTITAIAGDTLTVKTDAGEVHQVQVPSTVTVKRIAPGQRDLSTAEAIQYSDLATGDRVLVKLDPDATGTTPQALQVIAVKQADVAMKQQKDREEWQRNGIGGLVKSVDTTSSVVIVTSGAGATAKTITVHVAKATMLKRYAPGSVRFDETQPAPIEAIQAGDQLRARGTKNADGTEIAAEEVVSGGFRNISGTVTATDTAGSTLTVKDLITKKTVTIRVTGETQLRRLPETMARMIAARLKGGATPGAATGSSTAQSRPESVAGNGKQSGGENGKQWQGRAQGGSNGNGDMQQILSRAPTVQLSELQKGEAVMLVSNQGASEVTAITLVAGVEPLLEAPAASQNLLSNWSMGSGGAESAAQ
jgi:hypothetical protein